MTTAKLMPSYASDRLSRPMSPGGTVTVATYLPASRPGSGVQGTIVKGTALPPSASLPMIAVKADLVQLGVGSPAIPKKVSPDEEIAKLRKRLRLLETELKKSHAALHREHERAEHGTTRQELERQVAVWDRAKEQWQKEHDAELQRMRDEYEGRLDATSRDWDKRMRASTSDVNASAEARLAALKEDLEAKALAQAERDKEERIELLKRQSARRMLNAGLANGWSAWLELWEAKTCAAPAPVSPVARNHPHSLSIAHTSLLHLSLSHASVPLICFTHATANSGHLCCSFLPYLTPPSSTRSYPKPHCCCRRRFRLLAARPAPLYCRPVACLLQSPSHY